MLNLQLQCTLGTIPNMKQEERGTSLYKEIQRKRKEWALHFAASPKIETEKEIFFEIQRPLTKDSKFSCRNV